MRKPIAIDLFCGCGGLTEGLKQAGFNVIGALDVDALCVETYRANHTDTIVWELDIRELPVSQMRARLGLEEGELDLLAGCPPCQGFSSIRTLNGGRPIEDQRNDLVLEVLRFAEELRPKTVMLENVPHLASDERIRTVRTYLAELGYRSQCRIVDAADYGVPQRRKRMILIASVLGFPEFASPPREQRTVRDAIGFLPPPGQSGDPLHDLPERRSKRIMRLIRAVPRDGGSRRDAGPDYQLDCHKRCDGFKDVYGRMAWGEVAPTITGGCVNPSKGRFLHPARDGAITLREAALLQTFPSGYKISLRRGKHAAAALIGNALPPALVRYQAGELARHLRVGRA